MMAATLVMLAFALLLISLYYWLIHPIVLFFIVKFRSSKKTEDDILIKPKNNLNWFHKILVIPTFGSRRIIIEKIHHLNEIFNKGAKLDLDRIYIVFSEPSNEVLKDTEQTLNNSPLRDKIELIIEEERKGKAHAINHAITLAKKSVSRGVMITIINDDDAFFAEGDIKNLISCFLSSNKVAAAAIYPFYNSKILNLVYRYKRFIHKLESRICNPVIGGELMAFRTDIIDHLEEYSFSEDFQVSLLAEMKGYRTMVLEGNVLERYPSKIAGIRSRTRRVVLGTFLELSRYLKHLCWKCKYVYTTYALSLLLLPLSFVSLLIFILVIITVMKTFSVFSTITFIIFLFIILLTSRSSIKFFLGISLGTLDALLLLIKKKYFSERIEMGQIWTESKYK